ncbi:MAG: ABC transporter ATP-binding protein [Thermoclostridium sp.]|nr:ABC transporter ATP-binding protein [Thermoclostridium sp.]
MSHEEVPMIACDNLVKIYKTKEIEVVALQGLDLTIHKGELTAIIGKSGSGKSTLLNVIAGLDRPSAGSIHVDGKNLLKFNDKQLMQYNRETIGFVWQNKARNLLPYLSAEMNVQLPMMITGLKGRRDRARELLDMVGLKNRYKSTLKQLSGGEQQRVAIAIALANNPKLILADEPTGAVDSKTTVKIMDLMQKLNEDLGVTIVIVTHDLKLSSAVNRVISISDGMIGSEMVKKEDYQRKLSELGDMANPSESHDEFAVVDNKGRIKIPEEYIAQLKLGGGERLKIRKSAGGIEVYKT